MLDCPTVSKLASGGPISITSVAGRLTLREASPPSLEFYSERTRRVTDAFGDEKNIQQVLKYVGEGEPGPWIDKINSVSAWMDAVAFPTYERDCEKLFIQARVTSLLSSDVEKLGALRFVQSVRLLGDRGCVKVRIELRD